MRIKAVYSHLNGQEHILVHKPRMWKEIEQVIAAVDASSCRTKVSKEKTMVGKMLYSPIAMNSCFSTELNQRGWHQSRTSYWVTEDYRLIRKTLNMPAAQQKDEIQKAGLRPIFSYGLPQKFCYN